MGLGYAPTWLCQVSPAPTPALQGYCLMYHVSRDTSIQALRQCLLNSSIRPSDRLLQDMDQLMRQHISSSEDSTRTVAAACLGAMCRSVEDEQQLVSLVNSVILGNYSLSIIFVMLSPVLSVFHRRHGKQGFIHDFTSGRCK